MKIHCLDPNGINIHEKKANEVLEKSLPDSWKGYSSLEMIGKQTKDFETDIIIITADRIIVVELKDYNGKLYSRDGKWIIQSGNYEGTRTNGARQVSTAAKILASRIKSKLEHKLPMVPWVDKCVVLCGSATNEFLPEDEQKIVFSLEEFKNIGKPKKYKDFFGDSLPHWCTPSNNRKRPNQNLSIWDKFFTNNSADFKPKIFTANGYAITGKALFQHRDKIYSEYSSQRKNDRNYKALMRRWDFTASTIRNNARTPDERELIAYRESKVLGYIDNQDESLKNIHLNLLYTPENATADFVELYEWPRNRLRLNEFIAKNKEKLSLKNRLDIIQIFLSHLARLHEIDVAHRDIGAHSVWVSLPSGISLSNFLTASYPDPKNETVRNVREYLKHGRVEIPEDLYEDSDGTPYTRDVYLAGAVAHYIAYNRWPKKDEDGVYIWELVEDDDLFDGTLNDWLKTSLNYEAKERFQNINLALDDFNNCIKEKNNQEMTSLEIFKQYYSDIIVYSEYQAQVVNTKGTSMLLRSGDGEKGIKLWNGVSESTSNGEINYHLLTVLGRIQQLKNTEFDNISRIIDFGYNPSMQSLFIAYEWLEGIVWSEWIELEDTISREDLETTLHKFLKSTAHIHRLGFIHGDIHPKNIILKNGSPIFIDLIEFSNEGSSYNPSYVPDNFENLSLIARDRYAVVKMVLEVADKQNLIHLAEHCRNLIEQPEVSEGDFNRLIDNYKAIVSPPPAKQISIYEITGRNFKDELEEIESDDGLYYISTKIEENDHGGLLKLFIVGIKQQVDVHINTDRKIIVRCYPPKPLRHDQFIRNKRTSDIELEGQIILHNGSANRADELIEFILDDKSVKEKIERLKGIEKTPPKNLLTLNTYKADPIRNIWQCLVETEYEVLPKIIITELSEDEKDGSVLIRFSIEDSQMDFNLKTERVELKKEVDGSLRSLGIILDIGRDVLRYKPRGRLAIQTGDILRLEGALTASSLIKRKKAMEALINNRAVVSNIPDYFDPSLKMLANKGTDEPTNDDLDSYTEVDDETGNIIFKLNDSQRDAFRILYSYSPLGLLQGPPGTGKTAFIGSFIHYSVKHGTKRVLLVSQSHESVNNAAEKVKTLFERKNEHISIVRLGDEGNVSEALSSVQEIALQDYYREKFRAEFKKRIHATTKSLALPEDFINVSIQIELSLGRDIEAVSRVLTNDDIDENAKSKARKRINRIIDKAKSYLPTGFHLPIDIDELSFDNNIREKIVYALADYYDIDSPHQVDKYKNILHIATEWLSVMSSGRSQFQNFLTKTRTLVCGTCVGIGRNHYGMDENIYDLVIIDEAARATASEMAIAIQVGKKIILVGDHKQLPPQLDDDHIKAAKRKLKATDEAELKRSDFERAFLSEYGKQVGQQLSIQYRMAPPIGDLVSHCFYNETLQTGRGNCDKEFDKLPEKLGSTVTWIDTSKDRSKAYDRRPKYKDGNPKSWENEYEANVIISLIETLYNQDVLSKYFRPSEEPKIGVICMYSEQRRLLIKKIHELSWIRSLLEQRIIKIDTVDSYQGKENPIIITSLVRNNARGEQGFLYSENRANVALSRAKERLYIIGATRMWKNYNSGSPFEKVLSYIENKTTKDYQIINANAWEDK